MQAEDILHFWFEELSPAQHFAQEDAIDAMIRVRFGPIWQAAQHCELWEWRATPQGRLAEIVVRYTQTFLWLQRYDEGLLTDPRGHPGGALPPLDEARAGIASLKADLVAKGQASALFGLERDDGLAALLGNLDQTAFGAPAYPTLESRAAHLLYFVVKNHPFADGNKRIGALLFAGFLHHNGRLFGADGSPVVNDVGLAALSLLVAQSRPPEKDVLIRLIMNMLAGDAA